MKVTVDTDRRVLVTEGPDGDRTEVGLFTPDAFATLSHLWVRTGWALKYEYSFTWLGRPVIQLPEDLLRVQEVFYRVSPDVVIESGVAQGGSLVFYASLCRAVGRGRVIGIDIDIRAHNRVAIEQHELAPLITLVEGSSVAVETLETVMGLLTAGERTMVVLDSNHSRAHVAAELEAYAPLVSTGGYLVVTDGVMEDLSDVPGGKPEWLHDNPRAATTEFLGRHPEFRLEEPPPFPFNEGQVQERVTHWPDAYLRRLY